MLLTYTDTHYLIQLFLMLLCYCAIVPCEEKCEAEVEFDDKGKKCEVEDGNIW